MRYRHSHPVRLAGPRDVFFLVGFIFAIVGAIFTSIGITLFACFDRVLANGPEEAVVLPLVTFTPGVIFLMIGLYLCFCHLKKSLRVKALIAQDYYVMADIVTVMDDWGIRYNGRPTYVVQLSYKNPDMGNLYFFRSGNLAFNPEGRLSSKQCRVYLDPDYTYESYFGAFPDGWRDEMRHYYVDIDSILNF